MNKLIKILKNYWIQLAILLGSILMAAAGILLGVGKAGWVWFFTTKYGWIFTIGAILSLIGTLKQIPNNKLQELNNNKLQELNKKYEENYLLFIQKYLSILSKTLNFTYHERISLYKHNGQAFVMISRYSLNRLHQKPGRAIYPENEGCIGKAWREGSCFVDNLPESEAKWIQMSEKHFKIPQTTSSSITMKSRTIGAFVIKDHNITNHPIAIIVFESMNPQAFPESDLKNFFSQEELKLSILVKETEKFKLEIDLVAREGF